MNANEYPRTPRRFRRVFRWFLWSLAIALLLLVIAGGFLAMRHWWAVDQLAKATVAEDANHPGWRLEDIEAARADVPDERNGMVIVHATTRLLPPEWPPRDVEWPNLATLPVDQRLDPDMLARLRELLEACQPARAEARKLTAYSTGRVQLSIAPNPMETLLPHVQEARTVTFLLAFEALTRMEDGELGEAALLCRAAHNAARSIGDEPFTISQLVRIACVLLAGEATERLLARGGPSITDLALLQRQLEEEIRHPGLLLAYRGERGLVHATFAVMEDGNFVLDLGRERLRPPTRSERWYMLPGRDTLRLNEVEAFSMTNKLVEIAEKPAHQRAELLKEFRAMVLAAAKRGNMAALLLHDVDKLEAAFKRRDCYLSCLTSALAAERYRRMHCNWPPSLEALAPEFLAESPFDPFDAQPLHYLAVQDGIVIYSLCPDGKGAVFDPKESSPPGEGIAVRLWDVAQRKLSK